MQQVIGLGKGIEALFILLLKLGISDIGFRTKELGVRKDISKQVAEKATNQMGIQLYSCCQNV